MPAKSHLGLLLSAASLVVASIGCHQPKEPMEFTRWTGMRMYYRLSPEELDSLTPEVRKLYSSCLDPGIIGRSAADFEEALLQAQDTITDSGKIVYGFRISRPPDGDSEGDIYFGILVDQDTGKIVGVFSHGLVS